MPYHPPFTCNISAALRRLRPAHTSPTSAQKASQTRAKEAPSYPRPANPSYPRPAAGISPSTAQRPKPPPPAEHSRTPPNNIEHPQPPRPDTHPTPNRPPGKEPRTVPDAPSRHSCAGRNPRSERGSSGAEHSAAARRGSGQAVMASRHVRGRWRSSGFLPAQEWRKCEQTLNREHENMADLRSSEPIRWRTALAAFTPWSLLGRLRKRRTEKVRSERLRTLQDATLETIRARQEALSS